MVLTPAQRQRYARHLLLPEVGERGQLALLAARVRVTGDGPAAEEAAKYLASAGVGLLVLEPALARLDLAAMNPDVAIEHSGDEGDGLLVTPHEPQRRASGADAALQALFTIIGLETT